MIKELLYSLKRPFHLIKTGLLNGLPAAFRYKFPQKKLKVIAITGTDGKTTTSTLTYHILKNAGIKVGLISTVAAYIGETQLDTGFHVTTPQPSDIYKVMKRMVDEGMTHVVLEVTSHGAYQHREWGIYPFISGVTNIAREHLDYHLDYDRYVAAKALILNKAQKTVINADDESASKLLKLLNKPRKIITYSKNDVLSKASASAITKRFKEEYNQMNARLAVTICSLLEISDEAIASAIASFPGVPGRMQEIKTKKPFSIIVDFAHTPQALEAALTALKGQLKPKAKLIAVFGCAGLRDHTKRAPMGTAAAQLADAVVLTSEDPRTENIWDIMRQIKQNIAPHHHKFTSIPDRQTAISFAINTLAKPGDIVGIFGKGHEQSMCYGTTEYPWSDAEAVLKATT